MKAILKNVTHRPWPLPTGPWVMAQSWHDLLFAHWPGRRRSIAPTSSSAVANRHLRGACLARGSSVPHDRCTVARGACGPVAFGISRTECPYLCDLRRKTRRVVFQPGSGKLAGRCHRAGVVSPAILSSSNELRRTGRLDPLPERADASRSASRIAKGPISLRRRGFFPAPWDA